MQRKSHLALAIVLLLSLSSPVHAAAPKAGTKCTKLGMTAIAAGKKYTCIKSGKNLVWDKGVAVKKPAPVPSANPSPSETPTPSPTQKKNPLPPGQLVLRKSKLAMKHKRSLENGLWHNLINLVCINSSANPIRQ